MSEFADWTVNYEKYKRKDWVIKQGDSWEKIIQFIDEDLNTIDITGWTVFFTVKENLSKTDGVSASGSVIEKEITSHSDATAGQTTLELSKDDTDLTGNYIYEIQVATDDTISEELEIRSPISGIITFEKELTTRIS